ncbi:hypothetical protein [Candidatus Mycobacterium methanotrophicum]|uniref:Uncharacterized protein n=1 Tax=Candidatus Mycobacterium methanotrophicum TaxID=2943498 RepID=A0ABY4QLN2_9MYCO|nr:hypothetical protein [Candidatus Mycobacterium methanotrophicum]UQX11893.1 hypothetical protein M5I08_05710 [Candidatus Mycobacterium methanotrophicum]
MAWMYLPVLFVGFAFVATVLVTGSVALRAPLWDIVFRDAAFSEVQQRGFPCRQISLRDADAIGRILGPEPTTSELGELTLVTLAVFSGSTDMAGFITDIEQQRQALLDRMRERQLMRVKDISTVEWVSRVWVVQQFLSRAEVAVRGIIWLAPKTATGKHSAVSRRR